MPQLASLSLADKERHLLRVLVVDDNALNLSVLTKLLRKKFAHMLDDAPVAVDSGLKALQLLRENVYDVVLMDIQMPFLSGVDCTQRIRQGADGIIEANRFATVVAVTTATGDEPEALYRRSGFDGLIAKPVRQNAMDELLSPLLSAARDAASEVDVIDVNGSPTMPPLPMSPIDGDRLFFLPTDRKGSDCAPEITKSRNFELLLKEQTRISLHRYGANAMARTGVLPGVSDRRRLRQYDDEASDELDPLAPSRLRELARHRRRPGSLTISQSDLNAQIQREMEAAKLFLPRSRSESQGLGGASAKSVTLCEFASFRDDGTEMTDEPLSPSDDFADRRSLKATFFDRRRSSADDSVGSNSTSFSSEASSSSPLSYSPITSESPSDSPLTPPDLSPPKRCTKLPDERCVPGYTAGGKNSASAYFSPDFTIPPQLAMTAEPCDEQLPEPPSSPQRGRPNLKRQNATGGGSARAPPHVSGMGIG